MHAVCVSCLTVRCNATHTATSMLLSTIYETEWKYPTSNTHIKDDNDETTHVGLRTKGQGTHKRRTRNPGQETWESVSTNERQDRTRFMPSVLFCSVLFYSVLFCSVKSSQQKFCTRCCGRKLKIFGVLSLRALPSARALPVVSLCVASRLYTC